MKQTRTTKDASAALDQGARVMRSDEYQALTYAIEACRMFVSRQNRDTYVNVTRALNMLAVFTNWKDER